MRVERRARDIRSCEVLLDDDVFVGLVADAVARIIVSKATGERIHVTASDAQLQRERCTDR